MQSAINRIKVLTTELIRESLNMSRSTLWRLMKEHGIE